MKPFRFVHAADLHLDSPFRGLQGLPKAVRERVRTAGFRALQSLVELAVRERVNFVVVAGDVYDASDRSLRAQIRFREAAQRLAEAGIPLFVVHGNHDPEDGRSARLKWPENVTYFSTREVQWSAVRSNEGETLAHVYGISFGTSAVTANLAAQFSVQPGAPYHIALLHANVDGNQGHDNYAPCTLEQLKRSGFDYWALGHVHDRRVLSERPHVVYPGNLQGRSMKERGAKGCYLVDVGDSGRTQLRFVPLDDIRWLRVDCSIEDLETEEQLLEAVRTKVAEARLEADGHASMLRIVLMGRGPLHSVLRKNGFVEELATELRHEEERFATSSDRAPFVWLESIQLDTNHELDREALVQEQSFVGELLRQTAMLMNDQVTLTAFAEEALVMLAAHPQLGSYTRDGGEEQLREWLRSAEALALDSLIPAKTK